MAPLRLELLQACLTKYNPTPFLFLFFAGSPVSSKVDVGFWHLGQKEVTCAYFTWQQQCCLFRLGLALDCITFSHFSFSVSVLEVKPHRFISHVQMMGINVYQAASPLPLTQFSVPSCSWFMDTSSAMVTIHMWASTFTKCGEFTLYKHNNSKYLNIELMGMKA